MPASEADLRPMTATVDTVYSAGGVKVVDQRGRLRGLSVRVEDADLNVLSVEAVRVHSAPARWHVPLFTRGAGETSRSVLHSKRGVWLLEVTVWQGCGGDGYEYWRLHDLADSGVRAAQLNL
jgi:hypothetical protein